MSLGVMPIRTIMLVHSYRMKPIYTCNSGSLIRLEEIKVILLLFSLQNQISTHTNTSIQIEYWDNIWHQEPLFVPSRYIIKHNQRTQKLL